MENFKQTRKVGVAGGFFNQMMGNNSSRPVVGEGATVLMYSDRDAYQVTWVSDCGTQCIINPAIMKYTGTNYGDETYEYQGYHEGGWEEVVWHKGSWCKVEGHIKYEPKFERMMNEKYIDKGKYWYGSDADNEAKSMGVENLFNEYCKLNVVSGITKMIKRYNKISILFGSMNQYRDPSF
jgi:hypothetical protein